VPALITTRLVPMLAVVAGFALAGPIVATASATDNSIIRVVDYWSPIVKRDDGAILASQTAYKKNRRAGPLVAAYRHDVADLRSFASKLEDQSASTMTIARGRDEIAAGSLQIAKAYQRFASELQKAGARGLSKQQISTNMKIQLAGHDEVVAGFNVLKKL
jgi:hypothetical protein